MGAKLGQNFLVDPNILGVIERLAELGPQDIVLEVGGGQGILSRHLAARARWLHVIELDRGLTEPLRDALAPFEQTTLHVADAMELPLAELEPPPTKLVANLPYGIAAGLILRVLFELPGVELLLVMVQREVGERFAAAPGSRTYGIPSVLSQLCAEVKVVRPISRRVFQPQPNVDSVLLRLRRSGPPPPPVLRALVQGGFAHRRKSLARSLALSRGMQVELVRAALLELGQPADARAERLAPAEWAALGERCAS